MEKETKKNKIWLLILIIVIASVFIVGISYAISYFTLRGNQENKITVNSLSLTYTEAATGILINNFTPMTDSVGMSTGYATNFTVSASADEAQQVPYLIYLSLDENNSINQDYVKFYLINDTTSQTFGPVTVSDLQVKNIVEREYFLYQNSFSLVSGSLSQTHQYTLRVWVTTASATQSVETVIDGKTQTTEIESGSFKFKVNVESGSF